MIKSLILATMIFAAEPKIQLAHYCEINSAQFQATTLNLSAGATVLSELVGDDASRFIIAYNQLPDLTFAKGDHVIIFQSDKYPSVMVSFFLDDCLSWFRNENPKLIKDLLQRIGVTEDRASGE